MTRHLSRKSKSITANWAELAVAVPLVMAHRVARIAMAGPALSARDRKEFDQMFSEKNTAFAQAWQAMAAQAIRANQDLALSFVRSMWSPSGWGEPAAVRMAARIQVAALGILEKGIEPVHRKAIANAKRLAGTRLR